MVTGNKSYQDSLNLNSDRTDLQVSTYPKSNRKKLAKLEDTITTAKMTRSIAFLLLVIASSSSGDPIQSAGAVVALSSSFVRTPPISIDASTPIIIADEDANANADDGNNTTNATTTASPTKALAPGPAPAPTIPPTSPPSKKYVSPDGDDDGDDESEAEKIEREIPKIATVFLWVSISFASIWLVCYFRDAIIFFFGNVRRRPNRACLLLCFPHITRRLLTR